MRNPHSLLCPECASDLRPITEPRCYRCGRPVREDEEYCRDCAAHPKAFTRGQGIFLYDERMKHSVLRYKYQGCREYGRFYARAMYQYGGKAIRGWRPDLLVPVPLYPRKQRMRGFNQAQYLAQELSTYTGIPADAGLVRKIRPTRSQKKLNARERSRNLKDAFWVTRRVDGLRILLIDDVYTTGSTMDAMAHCLRRAGASEIFFLTLCIVA